MSRSGFIARVLVDNCFDCFYIIHWGPKKTKGSYKETNLLKIYMAYNTQKQYKNKLM